jgi:hypothetical protein
MSMALRGFGHLQRYRGSGFGEEHGGIQIEEFGDKWRRQGRMRDMAGLGFVEKARRRGHAHNTAQLRLWHAGQFGDVFGRDAAIERDARKYLEFAQPLQTREELILHDMIKRGSAPK